MKVAVITSAAQGLGLSIAEALLNAGFKVALTDVNEVAVQAVAKNIVVKGEALGLKLDVLSEEDFQTTLKKIVLEFGSCDVLVNNVAMTPPTPVMEITGEYFSSNNYGRIINMASFC